MKKSKKAKKIIIEQLRKTPIIETVCQKLDISRMTIYRWRKDDKEFSNQIDEAIIDGRYLINDLAENQLISAVKDKNFSAISYWLKHHHPSYANKLQIKHELRDEKLTPEQEEIIKKALQLAEFIPPEEEKEEDNLIIT
jgi:ACT domain-containing protein